MKTFHFPRFARRAAALATACALAGATLAPMAHAHGSPSDASAASSLSLLLPVAVSVAAPAMLLAGGAMLTVVAVEASTAGTVWVLERASDGARASVTFGAQASEGLLVATGTVVLCSAIATGTVLSAAGRAIAFIPNEIGAALLHEQRLTR